MVLRKPLILLGIIALNCISFSRTANARMDLIPGSRYTSARGAAMGDAFLPLGDELAVGLFYNPALLARLRRGVIEPINLSAYGSQTYFSTSGTSFVNPMSLGSLVPTLKKAPGTTMGSGAAFAPTFGFPGLAAGVLMQSQFAAQYNVDGTVSYRSLYQFIPAIGTGVKFFQGIIRFGYSLQWVNQASGSATIAESDVSGFGEGLSKGWTLSHTFGSALTIPVQNLPTFNFVVRNAFDSSFRNTGAVLPLVANSSGVPDTEVMTMDGSFSIHPKLGSGTTLNLSSVYRDITNRSGAAPMAHYAFGAEMNFHDRFYLRGGYTSSYPSAGLGLRNRGSELSLSWYSEEIGGQYKGQRDARFMLQYQIRSF